MEPAKTIAIEFKDVSYARRIPDPVFEDPYRYVFVVSAKRMPKDIPDDPNARSPKTNRRVYKKVEDSLFNRDDSESGTFHLKNGGITIVAKSVRKTGDQNYEVVLQKDGTHGIVDGGHTYEIITKAQSNSDLPEEQHVFVEILTGIEPDWIPDIAGGLNTSVQVQPMSLDNLAKKFDWMKEELQDEPYYDQIAWSENDSGEFDARDLVALMCLFNVDDCSNDDETQPLYAYSKKSQALQKFEDNPRQFENMRPIIKDIFRFHDIVRCDYHPIWNEQNEGKAGRLSFSEPKRKGEWEFIFYDESAEKTAKYRMVNGALYPILSAFRWFVETDPDSGLAYWRNGFEDVLDVWEDCALALIKATHEMSRSLGNKPNAIGKSGPHWSNLHNLVAKRDLQRERSRS